jgi:hypothetical protein
MRGRHTNLKEKATSGTLRDKDMNVAYPETLPQVLEARRGNVVNRFHDTRLEHERFDRYTGKTGKVGNNRCNCIRAFKEDFVHT